jgi:hypothetical protein
MTPQGSIQTGGRCGRDRKYTILQMTEKRPSLKKTSLIILSLFCIHN